MLIIILVITKHLKSSLETFITKKATIDDPEANQIQIDMVLDHLKKYSPKSPKYINAKNNPVKNVKKIYEGRNKIIKEFKNNIFQVYYDETQEKTSESESESASDEESTLKSKKIDTTDMSDLESEESAAERRKKGQGLKILTPNQMLSRLPITLAQLKAGNNSEKLKNEIRQLLYSLYRSKKLAKQLNKGLIDII